MYLVQDYMKGEQKTDFEMKWMDYCKKYRVGDLNDQIKKYVRGMRMCKDDMVMDEKRIRKIEN